MGYTIETNSHIDVAGIFTALINDLAGNGFTVQYHNGSVDVTDATEATLEAGLAVDVLNGSQPWRVKLNGNTEGGSITFGTPLQLPDSGSEWQTDGVEILAGRTDYNPLIGGVVEGFCTPADINPATPWSLRTSITDRGFCFEMWQNADILEKDWSMLCCQRLVDPVNGSTYITSHSPVIAFYSIDEGVTFNKIIVREDDVIAPTVSTVVSEDSDYVNAVINPMKQISIAETNQYYITFPAGFNTHRHLYNEEMDMIAYTSGGVLSQFNDAKLNVYGHGELEFGTGQEEIFAGDKIVGSISSATATVKAVSIDTGAWGSNDATGTLLLHSINGDFVVGDNLSVEGVISATATADSLLEYRKYKGGMANVNNAEGARILFLVENGGI